jgi:hypothetical protein
MEPSMTLKSQPREHARTVGHVSHASQVRVDRRVQDILARRAALDRARRAAQHINSAQEQDRCRTSSSSQTP